MPDQRADDDRPEHPELFISYASGDVGRAATLHARLVAEGFRVWFDRVRLTPGCDWHKEIEAGCDAARVMLPLITPRWAKSEWTRYETYPHDAVIPLLVEGKPEDVLTPPLRRFQALALDPLIASDDAWGNLIAAIRPCLAAPSTQRPPVFRRNYHERNNHFVGREPFLDDLHEALHAAPSPTRANNRVWAITGLGGIGKTSVANEYVRRYDRLYRRIAWVDAQGDLQMAFASLHDLMRLGDLKRPDAAKAQDALHAFRGPEESLLVIDNVEDARAVSAWIPRDGGCRVLLTSRLTKLPPDVRTLELGELAPRAARSFLRGRVGDQARDKDENDRARLADRLGHLPLALEQAAAYMTVHRMRPGAYLDELDDVPGELLGKTAPGFTNYPQAVLATWRATTARLSQDARAILRLASVLGAAPIPMKMLLRGAEKVAILGAALPDRRPRSRWWPWNGRRQGATDGPPPIPDRAKAERAVRTAVAEELSAYSMVQDWNGEGFRVHPLVAEAEWLAMEKGEQRYAGELAAGLLDPLVPADLAPPVRPEDVRTILEHAAGLAGRFSALGAVWPDYRLADRCRDCAARIGVPPLARVFAVEHYQSARSKLGATHEVTMRAATDVAHDLYQNGEYAAALPILQAIRDGMEALEGPEHPDTLTSVNNLAACMRALGDAAGALPLYRRALESRERVLGPEHPDTLSSVNDLAGCMQALGDAAGALPLYRRALESRERVLGPEHPDTLRSVNDLAGCMQALGDAAGALPLYRRALESYERVLGPEHPDTLTSVNNLAACMQALGDAVGALPLYRRALESRERVLGPEHPDTLRSVNDLAGCMQALGDAAGALPLYRRALESYERVLGPEHPATLTSVNNLAACMQALGDAAGALPLYRRALESRERVLGPEHPNTLSSVNNLAACMQALGDAAGALPLYRRALESCERVLGPEHPDTLTSVNNLAGCMRALGDAAGALPLYRRALESCERVLGPEHPNTLGSVNNLAACIQALGDAVGALPLYRRALESRERVLGPEHPDTLRSVNDLAGCMQALGDAAGALPLYRRALESYERVLGPEHPATLSSVNNLAACMQALGDAVGALPLYRRALESYERVLGPEHPNTLSSVNNLAACMQALGDAVGALPLYRRALESRERVLGPEHPATLTSVNNLAACMQALGDAVGALPLYRRALESRERVLGPEHPNTLDSLCNLADCLDTAGQTTEAEALHRRALEAQVRKLGATHPDVLSGQNNLAHVLRKAGHPDLAAPYVLACAENTPAALGEAHPLTTHRRNNLALTLLMLRRGAEADALLRAAWHESADRFAIVSPATVFLALIAALLAGRDTADAVGRLKPLLLGPTLPRAQGVAAQWDAGYLLDYLRDALPPDSIPFLQAALAAINDPAQAPALDCFALWRDTPALSLEAPWPEPAL